MPNELTLQVQAGELPAGFCPVDYQDILNTFSQNQTVVFPTTFSGVTVSATKPADQTQVWLQLDTSGRPTRLYFFAQGAWLSQHPQVPGSTMIWTTTLPDFTTFDGGDANPVSAISGPMWEEVVALRAAFPVGVGTLPSTTAIAVGGTGGEEKHVLSNEEIKAHWHGTAGLGNAIGDDITAQMILRNWTDPATFQTKQEAGDGGRSMFASTAIQSGPFGTANATADGTLVNQGHNNMPPFVGVYFLRRTQKQFFVVT